MNKKLEKGITLIALIITIIVLLILAGVSIATLTGENGLLSKAVTAKEITAQKAAEEQVQLAIMASYNENGEIDLEELKENLNDIEGATDITEDITDSSFPLSVTINGQEVKLDKTEDTITAVAKGKISTPTTPEEPAEIEVTGVTLNKEELSLGKGEQETLETTIVPEDATNKEVIWTTSDESIATVENGVVTAIAEGTVTITVKTTSGEKTASCTVTVTPYTAYNIGDEVAVGGENFYVLEASDGNTATVTLLSKYNLNTEGTEQRNAAYSETDCAFSSTNYWSDDFTSSPFDLNDLGKESTGDAMAIAKSYGINKGAVASGLLSYDKACELQAQGELKLLNGRLSYEGWILPLKYWLADAYSKDCVYEVDGENGTIGSNYYGSDYGFGVRPVITISKSLVS